MTNTQHLQNPPYLQIALDVPDFSRTFDIVSSLPDSDHLILEAGTPLIKQRGMSVISQIRDIRDNHMQNTFIVADMKTLDTGALETQIAANAGADAIVVSGLAPDQTINNVISEAQNCGIYSIIDTINVRDPLRLLERLKIPPNIVELHRAIDVEVDAEVNLYNWGFIPGIKQFSDDILVAVAGGVQINNIDIALDFGADIIVVGRAITAVDESGQMAHKFLCALDE